MNQIQATLTKHSTAYSTIAWFMYGKPYFDYRVAHWMVHGTVEW